MPQRCMTSDVLSIYEKIGYNTNTSKILYVTNVFLKLKIQPMVSVIQAS